MGRGVAPRSALGEGDMIGFIKRDDKKSNDVQIFGVFIYFFWVSAPLFFGNVRFSSFMLPAPVIFLLAASTKKTQLLQKQAEASASGNMAKLSQEIEELKEVIEEKKGAHSRLKLEIDNFRQRTKSELATARGKAAIPLVQELLPIADEYEYAKQNLKIESDGQQAVVTKFEALFDKMLQTWKSLGIEKMNSVGEDFNPELHEAVSMIPSQEYKEAATHAGLGICDVF